MAKIVIVNRFNGNVICEGEAENIKGLLKANNNNGADLYGADLRGAKYGKEDELLLKYLSIGPIGSRGDYLQIFITNKQTTLKTGCFNGSVEDFKTAVEKNHGSNEHSLHYKAAIALVESIQASVKE